MPRHASTSLERFQEALKPVALDPEVDVTIEALSLTTAGPSNRNRYAPYEVNAATLYTVRRPGPRLHASERTLQVIFLAENGRFVSASHFRIHSVKEVEEKSRYTPTQPLGWAGIPLREVTERLDQYFHPDAIAKEQAIYEENKRVDLDRKQREADHRFKESLQHTWAARTKAIAVLGTDVATPEVLDYFLPLPKEEEVR